MQQRVPIEECDGERRRPLAAEAVLVMGDACVSFLALVATRHQLPEGFLFSKPLPPGTKANS